MSPLPKIYKKEDIELLRKLYILDKLSTTEISAISSDKFGQSISDSGIYSALLRNNIPLRSIGDSVSIATSTLDIRKSFLNEKTLEWIDGFNLGDGYIGFNKNRRDCRGARFNIGSTNREWSEYAMSGLKAYRPSIPRETGIIDKRHPRLTWASSTLTHPDIVRQAKRWYPNGIKIVPLDVRITPTSLLLWYLGDGSISKMGVSFFIRLATCGFTPEEIENILIPKLSMLGLNVGRHAAKNDIRISGDSLRVFFEIVGKTSPISCYNYKFEYGEWLNLYRLSEVAKNDQEKWRIQYMFKQGKLDCSTSPGNKLIMFTEEQRNKIRSVLDNRLLHDEYGEVSLTSPQEENIKISDVIRNDNERWNARYLVTRQVIKCKKSMLTSEQAKLLRIKLDEYGETNAIPPYMIENEFRNAREHGFPYYIYDEKTISSKLDMLRLYNPIMENNLYKWSGHGTEVANYFHPQMFECHKKGKMSPIEFFNSDIDLRRGIKKIIALYSKINESRIREICCNETASSRINNFPPRVMMSILHDLYKNKKITMLDPCSGFSGRLLGCYASDIVNKYIGIDLCDKTCEGLIRTKGFINKLDSTFIADIYRGSCLDIMPTIKESVDFIFTSPPFLDEEEYVGVPVERDYKIWERVFIRPFIEKSYDVLKDGGRFSVYTEAIRRNDFSKDFSNIAESVGFKKLDNIGFRMPKRENLRNGSTFRTVNVIVFEK